MKLNQFFSLKFEIHKEGETNSSQLTAQDCKVKPSEHIGRIYHKKAPAAYHLSPLPWVHTYKHTRWRSSVQSKPPNSRWLDTFQQENQFLANIKLQNALIQVF